MCIYVVVCGACVCVLSTVHCDICTLSGIQGYLSIYLFIYCCGLEDLEGFDLRGRQGEDLRICSIHFRVDGESGLTPPLSDEDGGRHGSQN